MRHPPTSWLVAAYLGYKAPATFNSAVENTLKMGDLLKQVGVIPI